MTYMPTIKQVTAFQKNISQIVSRMRCHYTSEITKKIWRLNSLYPRWEGTINELAVGLRAGSNLFYLISEIKWFQPELAERCKDFSADRGLDSAAFGSEYLTFEIRSIILESELEM